MDTAVTLSKTYKVGDYYNENGKEGVVFEVSADGNHGKIVSMVQSADWIQWSSDENEKVRLIGADSKTDGAYNMSKIKANNSTQLFDKGTLEGYWSSTEREYQFLRGVFCAWIVGMYYAVTNSNFKHHNNYVRAVATF